MKNSRNTLALENSNSFEFLASILATWDNTNDGLRQKRHALDQLLIRSEIDGYTKSRVNGDRDHLKWSKEGSDLHVYITRVGYGVYNIEVQAGEFRAKALNIEEL